jgi:hypothetical protein
MKIAEEMLGAADQNMVNAWRAVLAGAPMPGDVHDEVVVLLSSGLTVPLFNPAFVTAHRLIPRERSRELSINMHRSARRSCCISEMRSRSGSPRPVPRPGWWSIGALR